jgi:hypothetical protein
MMRHLPFTGLILLATLNSGHAIADCPPSTGSSWVRVTDLTDTLTGMTACSTAGQGTQEEHHADHELWDYKCGDSPGTVSATCPKPAVDLRRQVGTWSVENDPGDTATVTYHYINFADGSPGAEVGPLSVFRDGTTSTYDFCADTNSVGIFTLKSTTGTSRVCP